MHSLHRRHSIDSLFTFLLLIVFAMFTLALAGMGSTVYQNGISYLNENYTSRTAVSYVSEKIRQHEETGAVFLTQVEGIPALGLKEQIQEEAFLTYIYFYEGALCELMMRENTVPQAMMGSQIIELSDFSIQEVPEHVGLFSITAQGKEENEMSLLVRLNGEVGSYE